MLSVIALVGCTVPVQVTVLPAEDTGPTPDLLPDTEELDGPGDCTLTDDLDGVWFWEGDTVAFRLGCEEAGAEVALSMPSSPPASSFSDGVFEWETGPSDGGRHDLVFSVQRPGAAPSTYGVTVWVADNPELAGAQPVVATEYTEEWGLPVFHLSAPEGLGGTYQPGTVTVDGTTLEASVKIRGASSANYPKKSYMLEFEEDELAVPGWDKTRDHLILLSTFDDNSYVRQKLVYDLWAGIAAHWDADRLVPRTGFAVVYLNGVYHGLYVMLDRIDNEFLRHMGLEDTGDLFKAVNHDANFYLTASNGSEKSRLSAGYEKKEGDPEDDFSSLEDLVAFTGSASAEEIVSGMDDWLDRGEFMDWLLLVHYTLSEDSAGKNSYLYLDPERGVFRYAPWDFNHAWGQNWYTQRTSVDRINSFSGSNRVFWALHEADSDALWARFAELRDNGPLALDALTSMVDGYYAEILPSAERDWDHWRSEYRSYGGWASSRDASGNWTEFPEEQDYLYTWLEQRAALYSEF